MFLLSSSSLLPRNAQCYYQHYHHVSSRVLFSCVRSFRPLRVLTFSSTRSGLVMAFGYHFCLIFGFCLAIWMRAIRRHASLWPSRAYKSEFKLSFYFSSSIIISIPTYLFLGHHHCCCYQSVVSTPLLRRTRIVLHSNYLTSSPSYALFFIIHIIIDTTASRS